MMLNLKNFGVKRMMTTQTPLHLWMVQWLTSALLIGEMVLYFCFWIMVPSIQIDCQQTKRIQVPNSTDAIHLPGLPIVCLYPYSTIINSYVYRALFNFNHYDELHSTWHMHLRKEDYGPMFILLLISVNVAWTMMHKKIDNMVRRLIPVRGLVISRGDSNRFKIDKMRFKGVMEMAMNASGRIAMFTVAAEFVLYCSIFSLALLCQMFWKDDHAILLGPLILWAMIERNAMDFVQKLCSLSSTCDIRNISLTKADTSSAINLHLFEADCSFHKCFLLLIIFAILSIWIIILWLILNCSMLAKFTVLALPSSRHAFAASILNCRRKPSLTFAQMVMMLHMYQMYGKKVACKATKMMLRQNMLTLTFIQETNQV